MWALTSQLPLLPTPFKVLYLGKELLGTSQHPEREREVKFPVYPSGWVLIRAFSEWQCPRTHPTQHYLHRSSKTPSGKWDRNLTFLLSAAPLKIIKPLSSTPFPKLRIPDQKHRSAASLLWSRSKVHGWVDSEWEESGGEGVCPGPSPPCRLQCPSQRSITSLHSAGLLSPESGDRQIPGTIPSPVQGRKVIHCEGWRVRLLLKLMRGNRP